MSYLSLILDMPALNLRAESVIYPRRSFLVGLALSTVMVDKLTTYGIENITQLIHEADGIKSQLFRNHL